MGENAITGAITIDSAGTLYLGTSSLGTTLGTSSQTTNIEGNVQINGIPGTSGQVLTSGGIATAPTWQTPASSTFVGTADKALDMGSYAINMNDSTNTTLSLTAESFTMGDVTNNSTAIINANQIVIADGVSGIVNSMTNVNSNMISGDGFKEITMSPESVILSDSSVLPSTTTITPNDINFAVNGDNTATYGKTGIALQNGALPNNLQISQDSIVLSNATKSLELTQKQIKVNGSEGTATQVFTKDIDNNVIWADTAFVPTATSDLDMNSKHINNIASLNATTNMNINGQAVFDTPPHIPDPILGNDAASKGYVDTLIGNYNGNGLTLYFNYTTTQTDPIIAPSVGELQQSIAPINLPTTNNYYTMQSVVPGTDTLISTFTTDVGYPNTLIIPTGLWSMMIWGYTTSATGQLYYHFHINEVDSDGDFVAQIATSGFSSDVNAVSSTDPDAYHCSLAIVNEHPMASVNSRLQIQIYTTATSPNSTQLFTLFGGDYYSNVTTTLNGATSLLTQNNTWTGVNDFTAGFNTTAVDSTSTLALGTGTATTTTLGRSGGTTVIQGATIGLTAPTSATITTPTINLSGAVKTVDIDSATTLALGTGTATTTTLGRSGGTIAINGTTIGLTAPTINLTGNVKSNNIDTATAGTLAIGNATTTNLTLGRSGLASANLNATSLAIGNNATTLTIGTNATVACAIMIGQNSLSTTSLRGDTTVAGSFRSDSLRTINVTTSGFTSNVQLYTGTTSGTCDMLTSTTRSSTTNFQNNSTLANTLNIGNALTTINFGNAIKGTGTTLGVSQPISPTSITYDPITGTTIAGAIGQLVIATGGASTPIGGSQTNLVNLNLPSNGVWLITGILTIRNTGSAGINDRLEVNLSYGVTGTTLGNVNVYTYSKTQLGTTGALGYQIDFPFSYITTVQTYNTPNNFVTLSAGNTGTTTLSLSSISSTLRVVRIA